MYNIVEISPYLDILAKHLGQIHPPRGNFFILTLQPSQIGAYFFLLILTTTQL